MAPKLRIDTGSKAGTTRPPIVKPRPHPATVVSSIYADDEREFMLAVHAFKTTTGRRFPTCSDYLAIVKAIGFARPVTANHGEAR